MTQSAIVPPARQETSAKPERSGLVYSANGDLRRLWEIEGDILRLAADHYNGRMSEIARRLGIGRTTLYRKLDEHQILTATGGQKASPD